ncbi:MAG: exodeoxyribonuclease V subunit gamma [Synechococcaceae cyanobacterium]
MLIVYRGNRAEILADLLAEQLRLTPPDPFTTVAVIVNTWPTCRWLSEQLAGRLGGISANLRFPFPSSSLRAVVQQLCLEEELGGPASGAAEAAPARDSDPWRAQRLVWSVLHALPRFQRELAEQDHPAAALLRPLLEPEGGGATLRLATWQTARAIADAFDDYGLYRPAMLRAWQEGRALNGRGDPLPDAQRWQLRLFRLLCAELDGEPHGLQVLRAIRLLERQAPPPEALAPLGHHLRLFGLSSMAPIQVRLLEALARHLPVELYLLSPCADLWQRCADRRLELSDALACALPLEQDWLLRAPGLEARFGRLGSEFQQLLEGCEGVGDGSAPDRDLFFLAATAACGSSPSPDPAVGPSLLAQLQEQLAAPSRWPRLSLPRRDQSLEFHACPGPLRQVQVVRDRVLQLLAADPSLEPRHILVMTPEVDRFAPLVAAVFSDSDATGVELPWRLTDRSQQSDTGVARGLLELLRLAADRLTASGLERLLQCRPLLQAFALNPAQANELCALLQRVGFRWGLDGEERGGGAEHSLSWAIDRLLLGLVLPATPGLAPSETAPFRCDVALETLGRWLALLQRLSHWLRQLRRPAQPPGWAERLQALLPDLFGDGGEDAWELPLLHAALADWLEASAGELPPLEVGVVAAVLEESLAADSGRFGHRSGALTISALEPMRAIPHRVIVLMGLEAQAFPRQGQRPSFHLMDQQRRLGDPDPADQDRYALLEALLSARDHLLLCWSNRDDRTGAELQPASPVRQWLQGLAGELPPGEADRLIVTHAASPLDPAEFQPGDQGRPPASSDRRLLRTLRLLRDAPPAAAGALVDRAMPEPVSASAPAVGSEPPPSPAKAYEDLRLCCREPQRQWLRQLGLRPSEWLQALDDLENLELAEQQRAQLLRDQLEADMEVSALTSLVSGPLAGAWAPDPLAAAEAAADVPACWMTQHRGQGLLPPGTAARLEARLLRQRWSSLRRCLTDLGPASERRLRWGGLEATTRWRGQHLVQVQVSKPKAPDLMELWLQLLLASAAAGGASAGTSSAAPAAGGSATGGDASVWGMAAAAPAGPSAKRPSGAILIARDGNLLQPVLTLTPPAPDQAAAELEGLMRRRQSWRERCWPVPPRTGWAYVEAEAKRPGQGWQRAGACWEGSSHSPGERQRPEMVVCFGADRPAASLLAGEFAELATAFYGPLSEAQA